MQTVSDPLPGWTTNAHYEHLDWRHFRDWKGSVQLEQLDAGGFDRYGKLCAATLAKAHARSGDRIALAACMAQGKHFDQAMAAYDPPMTGPMPGNPSAITSCFRMPLPPAALCQLPGRS